MWCFGNREAQGSVFREKDGKVATASLASTFLATRWGQMREITSMVVVIGGWHRCIFGGVDGVARPAGFRCGFFGVLPVGGGGKIDWDLTFH